MVLAHPPYYTLIFFAAAYLTDRKYYVCKIKNCISTSILRANTNANEFCFLISIYIFYF